jgi:hypothetical protein
MAEASELNWIEADDGYALALDGARLVCRNAKGKRLSSVPAAIRVAGLCDRPQS